MLPCADREGACFEVWEPVDCIELPFPFTLFLKW